MEGVEGPGGGEWGNKKDETGQSRRVNLRTQSSNIFTLHVPKLIKPFPDINVGVLVCFSLLEIESITGKPVTLKVRYSPLAHIQTSQ